MFVSAEKFRQSSSKLKLLNKFLIKFEWTLFLSFSFPLYLLFSLFFRLFYTFSTDVWDCRWRQPTSHEKLLSYRLETKEEALQIHNTKSFQPVYFYWILLFFWKSRFLSFLLKTYHPAPTLFHLWNFKFWFRLDRSVRYRSQSKSSGFIHVWIQIFKICTDFKREIL